MAWICNRLFAHFKKKKKKMWPLQYGSSCLLLVIDDTKDFHYQNNNKEQLTNLLLELCEKLMTASRTMIDFAPSTMLSSSSSTNTTADVIGNSNNNNVSSTTAAENNNNNNFERPAGAIFAVISGRVSCLWSPIGDGENPNITNLRNGEKVSSIVRERLLAQLMSSSSSSSSSSKNNKTEPTLEALVRCTATVQKLVQGNINIRTTSNPSPSLIRVISSSSSNKTIDDNKNNNGSNIRSTSWKDSICSLISTWENLNIKVSVETVGGQNDEQKLPACRVLQYLLNVSSSSLSSGSSSISKNNNNINNNNYQLTFVCPKCRAMIVPVAKDQTNRMLSVIALQEPPRCPRGCTTY